MTGFVRNQWIPLWLCGVMLLYTSCANSNHESATPSSVEMARQAEQALLEVIAIDSGAVVSFVGPVVPGTRLVAADSAMSETALTVPEIAGRCYVFFVNDHPDMRYAHPVRYVWLNPITRAFESVDAEWWPRLDAWPLPDESEFELIETDWLSGVLFYYGHGGGLGFPPTYLPRSD